MFNNYRSQKEKTERGGVGRDWSILNSMARINAELATIVLLLAQRTGQNLASRSILASQMNSLISEGDIIGIPLFKQAN